MLVGTRLHSELGCRGLDEEIGGCRRRFGLRGQRFGGRFRFRSGLDDFRRRRFVCLEEPVERQAAVLLEVGRSVLFRAELGAACKFLEERQLDAAMEAFHQSGSPVPNGRSSANFKPDGKQPKDRRDKG
jgi:hypothetical protein